MSYIYDVLSYKFLLYFVVTSFLLCLNFVYAMNNIAISKNIMTNGNNTRNQDKLGTPAWQIKLRIHVHNNT